MEIAEYTKAPGNFLKAEDVNATPNAIWLMQDEGEMVKSEKFDTTRLHISVVSENAPKETKTFDMSKTNARFVENILGTDTKAWIKQGLILETYRTKTSEGKMVDAINVKEVKKFVG